MYVALPSWIFKVLEFSLFFLEDYRRICKSVEYFESLY